MSIKTLENTIKKDKEAFSIPKTVQDVIPIKVIYDDGIFQVGKDKYSKCFAFSDINFIAAGEEEQKAIFWGYVDVINSYDSQATTKETIINRKMNSTDIHKNLLFKMQNDSNDVFRQELNEILLAQAKNSSTYIQERYLTLSINKDNIDEARNYFSRIEVELEASYRRIGSKLTALSTSERLKIFHGFFHPGEEMYYHFDISEARKRGHDFKDYICPDSMEFKPDYFKYDDHYGRVLYVRDYARYIKPIILSELTDLPINMVLSRDILTIPTEEAIKDVETKLLGVETEIVNWRRKQQKNGNFTLDIPYETEQVRSEMKSYMDDITANDLRMTQVVFTILQTAETKKQLDSDTEKIKNLMNAKMFQIGTLRFQQLDGLNTALPYGVRHIDNFRTQTSAGTGILIPFRAEDITHNNGLFYGRNTISRRMIAVDRKQLQNGNSIILGVSGGGKSFTAKFEISQIMLSSHADIIIIDPEREYSSLVNSLGGEVINISATSPNHINALDMSKEYGDGENPVVLKSEFIMSLCEQIGTGKLGAKEKSIIDRCATIVYHDYQSSGYKIKPPTLRDFRQVLLAQPEPEAKSLALIIELFAEGSLDTFAKETNVDTENRLICYDILELGKQLMPVGMLVVLDSILNRITKNRQQGKDTFIFIDEIYLLFQHEYSANFLFTLWKRVRKYGAYATGITQNVEDFLQSPKARSMIANSEFIIMLNQAATDRDKLANILNISNTQLGYITDAPIGHGLMRISGALVPFENIFPTNTQLYKLMTSKVSEVTQNN